MRQFLVLFAFVTSLSAVSADTADDVIKAADATPTPDWGEYLPVDQVHEDLRALYVGLQNAHVNLYAQVSPAEYQAFYESILNEIDTPIRRVDAQLALARLAAFGKVAHATVAFPNEAFEDYRNAGGRTFPLYLRIVDGVAYVADNLSGKDEIAPGDEVLAINGVPMSEWLVRTARHLSADSPYIAHSLLEFSFPRDLWAVAGEVETFDIDLRRGSRTFSLEVAATTRAQQREAAADQPEQFSLDASTRTYKMIDERLAYLRPGPFYNAEDPTDLWNNAAFLAFIDQAYESFLDQEAKSLIIDLRQNPGGDNSFSDGMLSWLADEPFRFCSMFLVRASAEAEASNARRLDGAGVDSVTAQFARAYSRVPRGQRFSFDVPFVEPRQGARFEGAVYVLINRHSYSNAVTVAAMVQDYGIGIIAGEKTSDMATTYGAMEHFTLPNTGISVGFPKAHIVRPSGDTRPDGITPDWIIKSPVVQPEEDIVLNTLIARIQSK